VERVSAFVLAGGRSSRMGTDKAFLEIGGKTLLDRAMAIARAASENVRVVGPPEKFGPSAVPDLFPGQGPLAGIHAALRASDTETNLILAVDCPFIPPKFVRVLMERAVQSKATVVVPKTSDGFQPLCAAYRHDFADLAETALREGRNKIDPLFAATATEIIGSEEIQKLGFGEDIFRNLNSPADLRDVGVNRPKQS
jgi:molybdopterin-guanine dinucleotide biosynthesis protein A